MKLYIISLAILDRIMSSNDDIWQTFESVETNPNWSQTTKALLILRLTRIRRDIARLYFSFFLPVGLSILGLYFNSIQPASVEEHSLILNGSTYESENNFVIYNGTGSNLEEFLGFLRDMGANSIEMYDGNFTSTLGMQLIAALNIDSLESGKFEATMFYRDFFQHSSAVVINYINNALYRSVIHMNFDRRNVLTGM